MHIGHSLSHLSSEHFCISLIFKLLSSFLSHKLNRINPKYDRFRSIDRNPRHNCNQISIFSNTTTYIPDHEYRNEPRYRNCSLSLSVSPTNPYAITLTEMFSKSRPRRTEHTSTKQRLPEIISIVLSEYVVIYLPIAT